MYVARHGETLDAQPFKEMKTHGNAFSLVDPPTGRMHNTSVGA